MPGRLSCGGRGEKIEFTGTVCGLKAVEAANTGRRKGSRSYPEEDGLSVILICLLQFCYFKTFLRSLSNSALPFVTFPPMFKIQKKASAFFFFPLASISPSLVCSSSSRASSPLRETNHPAPCYELQQKESPKSLALCRSCRKDTPCLCFEKNFFSYPNIFLL